MTQSVEHMYPCFLPVGGRRRKLSPADVNSVELHVVRSGVKADEERAQRSEKPPEQHHVSVPQLRLVPEGSDRVHQVRCL